MDKLFASIIIGFFVICACFLTWAARGGSKRSLTCKIITYGYAAFTWACIIALVVLTILYK